MNERVLSVVLTVMLVASSLSVAGVGAVSASTGNTSGNDSTFHVMQNGQCYPVSAMGDGSRSVEDFYDYRPSEMYASHGTTELQDNQVSNLFVYDGKNGTSLVFVHDELDTDKQDAPYGSTITFNFSNMGEGEWVVRDDNYTDDDGNPQDDNWNTSGSDHSIDWMWASHRTDGGAFLGIPDDGITIEPGFNEDAEQWDYWPYAGDEDNRTADWRLLDGDGSTKTSLEMDQQVTVKKGECPSDSGPTADFSVSDDTVANDETVEFDAGSSSDDGEIVSYEWDFGDGDSATGETTSHSYDEPDEYTATLTVTDDDGNTATASKTITVVDGSDSNTAPDADLTAMPSEGFGETEFTFDASNSSDDEAIVEYEWDFDGDGKYDRTTESPETSYTYSEVGNHEVTVQVADAAGNTDTASTNVTVFKVGSGDDEPPTARLSVPDEGSMSQLLYPFDATNSTDDDEIVKYKWDFDSDDEVEWTEYEDGISSIKPYQVVDEPGTYEATVTVVDSAGQTDTASATYTVEKVPPNATIHASSDSVEVGEEVTFTAKNFNEAPDTLDHICWKVGDEPGPDGTTWTTSFEESGQKTIKLVLRDLAGYEHVVTKDITVTAADDGDNGGDGGNGDDGNNGDKGYQDDPNDGNKGGGLPPANPDDGDDSNDDETVSAPLEDESGEMGQIAVLPAAEDGTPGLEVSQTAPARVEAPSVAEDGFEAVSYVTVTDADSATFTVSKDRLDEVGATAEDVTLFRYDDGTWTAVETEQVEETDDGFEFEADTDDATYAVGIDRPATSVTDLAVESQHVEPGETVEVVATVRNDGRTAGTHEVQLTVGGDVVATETVEVEAGATAEVTLTHAFDDDGTYDVSVDGEQTEVVVEDVETETTDDSDEADTSASTTTNDGAGVPGFGVGVSLVALLGAALLALRRR